MATIGSFLSCEEWGPNDLADQARQAEQAGFAGLWISDHYHPWTAEQGQSPFVWSVIGALSEVVSIPVTTAVTCPTVRIHPAVIAQAADADLVQAFRDAGGSGKPAQAGTKVCWGPDEDEARRTAHRLWATEQLPGQLAQELPTPRHFEQAATLVTPDMVGDAVVCGNDAGRHIAMIEDYLDAGYDEVYISQIGPQQEGFFDFYHDKVLPRFS